MPFGRFRPYDPGLMRHLPIASQSVQNDDAECAAPSRFNYQNRRAFLIALVRKGFHGVVLQVFDIIINIDKYSLIWLTHI